MFCFNPNKNLIMKKFNCLILFLLLSILCNAQQYINKFGIITQKEYDLKKCNFENNADAFVLFDLGKSYFTEGEDQYYLMYERRTRIKILKEAGKKFSEIKIPLYKSNNIYESIVYIEAITYNMEGKLLKKTKLEESNIFQDKLNSNWYVKKFALPNVKAGSIIEYKYKIKSNYVFNLRDWEFQWRIPVEYSEYEVAMMPLYDYMYILQGINKFDVSEKSEREGCVRKPTSTGYTSDRNYNDRVYKFGMKQVGAFKSEKYITSVNDYIKKIDFQLCKVKSFGGGERSIIKTWELLKKDLIKSNNFGRYRKRAKKLAKKLLNIDSLNNLTEEKRFNYVLNFVKSNYRWNSIIDKYTYSKVGVVLNKKEGNSVELNLLAIGLLNALKIKAEPLLISTRNHGKIKSKYPFIHFFNNAIIIAEVNNKMVLSDATNNLIAHNRIPIYCINDLGLVINKSEETWYNTISSVRSENFTYIYMGLENNHLNFKYKNQTNEYEAWLTKQNIKKKKDILNVFENSDIYEIDEESILMYNYDSNDKPYTYSYKGKLAIENVNNKIYLSPFLDYTVRNNPLSENKRQYPVDMIYPRNKKFVSIINLKSKYTIEFKPEDFKVNNELIYIEYSTKQQDNQVKIIFNYSFKKSVYTPKEYSRLSYYYSKIVKKANEKLVLKQITSTL